MVRSRHGMHRHSKSAQFTIAGWLIITPFRAQQCGGSCFPAQIFKEICSQQHSPALSSSLLFVCLLACDHDHRYIWKMAAILPASTAWDRYHHCCHNCCHCCKDSLQPSSAGTWKKGQVRSLCHLTRQKVLRQRGLCSCPLHPALRRIHPGVSPGSSRVRRKMDQEIWPGIQDAYLWTGACDESAAACFRYENSLFLGFR